MPKLGRDDYFKSPRGFISPACVHLLLLLLLLQLFWMYDIILTVFLSSQEREYLTGWREIGVVCHISIVS